ncbi:hypothetical protein D3C81_2084150 [compost metagenome]
MAEFTSVLIVRLVQRVSLAVQSKVSCGIRLLGMHQLTQCLSNADHAFDAFADALVLWFDNYVVMFSE